MARQLISIVDRAPSSPASVSAIGDREPDFGLRALRALAGSGPNVTVSPASLAIALAMLQNGARGATLAAIEKALGTSGISTTEQNEGWAGVTDAWDAAQQSGTVTIASANSLWAQDGLPVAAPFLTALGAYYNGGVWQVDFHQPSAAEAINAWTKQHTNNKIDKIFDELDPDTQLVLANAAYFKAAWAEPFDAGQTVNGPFTKADGSRTTASFMQTTGAYDVASTPAYDAVQLPYSGGRFSALAIMPKTGSLADYLGSLDGAGLASVVAGLRSQSIALTMPRFETSSVLPLNTTLEGLGMGIAFSDSADFSGLSSQPLMINQAIQRTYLKVAESGTEAAAVTGLGMVASGAVQAPLAVTLDHPFLFLIRDTVTGVVLFASTISDPHYS